MRKSLYLISISALILASCSSNDTASKMCGDGTQLPVIVDSIFSGTNDDNMTHESGECLSSEKCVYLYDSAGAKQNNYACSSVGQGKLKCGDKDVDALTDNDNCGKCGNVCSAGAKCESGICKGGEDETTVVCEENTYKCDADGVTRNICENNKWVKFEVCTNSCTDKACDSAVPDDYTKCNEDDTFQCSGDNTILQECVDGSWQDKETCALGCANNKCVVDSDGDGVSDSEDVCPNNGAISSGDVTSCLPYNAENGTFTVYTAANMTEFDQILRGIATADATGHELPEDVSSIAKGIKTVVFANDVNMSEFAGTPESGDCVLSTESWSGILDLNDISIDGKGHKLTAIRTSDGARCSLSTSLFNSLLNTSIKDIKIDLDVTSKDARGIIAASVAVETKHQSIMDKVTLSGTLNTDIEMEEEGRDGVGGMFGSVKGTMVDGYRYDPAVVFNNCVADGISVIAPNAKYVGGMLGYLNGANIKYGESTNYIKYVEGKDLVGGVIGFAYTNNSNIKEDDIYARFVIDTVKGNNYVGGYSGMGIPQALILVVNSVSGNDVVGGVSGSINNTAGMAGEKYTNSYINDIAVHTNKVVGRQKVAGLLGIDSARTAHISNIYAETSYLGGKAFVAGLLGYSPIYQTEIQNVHTQVSQMVDLIKDTETFDDISVTSLRYFAGVMNRDGSYGVSVDNVSSCSTIETTISSPSAGLFWGLESSYYYAYFNRIVAGSSRILNNSTFPEFAITNSTLSAVTGSAANVYILSVTGKEEAVSDSTFYKGVSGDSDYYANSISEKYLDNVLSELGEGWEVGSCVLTDASGMTSSHKMPVYRQKAIEDLLKSLKQEVSDKKYFTIED